MKAQIIKSDKRVFTCWDVSCTEKVFQATALGNLLKGKETLVVGDFVEVERTSQEEYTINKMYPRENEIFRILIRERKKKIIASNCDRLVIVMSVSAPTYKRGLVDRYLVRAHQWGIKPIIVFNKMDEYDELLDIKFEAQRVRDLGVESFEVCARDQNYKKQFLEHGMDDLKKDLQGKSSIFLGQSGVGKTKLITALTGGSFELKSAHIAKSGKGAHTTTWAEIVRVGDLQIIDSPGIRSYSLDDIDPQELAGFFPDIEEVATNCKFKDCKHFENSKGCGFFERWKGEEQERSCLLSRLESFQRLYDELSETPQWKKSF